MIEKIIRIEAIYDHFDEEGFPVPSFVTSIRDNGKPATITEKRYSLEDPRRVPRTVLSYVANPRNSRIRMILEMIPDSNIGAEWLVLPNIQKRFVEELIEYHNRMIELQVV